jgi:hypothetical protein
MTLQHVTLRLSLVAAAAAALSAPASAQTGPPLKGTMALEATMKSVYRAANVIIVETREGLVRTYKFGKDLLIHGTPAADPFEGLRPGTTVVLHYQADETPTVVEIDRIGADDGLIVGEGTVVSVDRRRRVISVRFASGVVERFGLTAHAAAELPADDPAALSRVRIYYRDEAGSRIVHSFVKLEREARKP